MEKRKFIYRIDSNDLITYVNQSWVEFAQENSAPELIDTQVISKPLWDFIADDDTVHIYKILLAKVRAQSEKREIEFRCDSPDCLRRLQLQLQPLENGEVEFVSTIVEQQFREANPLIKPPEQAAPKGNGTVITMCSWCKSVKHSDAWLALDDAIITLGLIEGGYTPPISHGICESCKAGLFTP